MLTITPAEIPSLTPTGESSLSATPGGTVTLEETATPAEKTTPTTIQEASLTPSVSSEKKTTENGGKTLFWAVAVITGAGVLWVVGQLLGPSTSLKEDLSEKKDEN